MYPDSVIVTADDDALYPKDWLSKLYNAYTKNPHFIHCHRAHRVSFDASGTLLPYAKWESCLLSTQTAPSFLNFFTGVGGVLYPPHCFYKDILDEKKFIIIIMNDDIWFFAMAVLNNVKINVVEGNYTHFESFVDFDTTGALWHINVQQGKNDKALQYMLESYPALKEKIGLDVSK